MCAYMYVCLYIYIRKREKAKRECDDAIFLKEKWAFSLIRYTHTSCLSQESAT